MRLIEPHIQLLSLTKQSSSAIWIARWSGNLHRKLRSRFGIDKLKDRVLDLVPNCLQNLHRRSVRSSHNVPFGATESICYKASKHDGPKICLTQEMLPKFIKWYHEKMAHIEGSSWIERTLKRHFYHPKMDDEINKLIQSCEACQKYKWGSRQYGELSPRDAVLLPWQEIHCDTIGPWTIDLRAQTLEFKAITTIDPVTNLVKITPLITKTAAEVAAGVENNWIACYPRPLRCVSDQGPEFSEEFTNMLANNGIKHRFSSARNPQGNSIVERIHQAIGNVLRIQVAAENPKTRYQAERVIHKTLATAKIVQGRKSQSDDCISLIISELWRLDVGGQTQASDRRFRQNRNLDSR